MKLHKFLKEDTNTNLLGSVDSHFFEKQYIKRYYPEFYKKHVQGKRKKKASDKMGLPKSENLFVWLPRSAE